MSTCKHLVFMCFLFHYCILFKAFICLYCPFYFRPLEVLIVEYFQKLANLTPALLPECTPPPPLPPNLLSVSFTQLGGDSISAMRLANLFDEHFNKLVSVQAIMTEPLHNILQLVLIKNPGVEVQTSYSIDWKKEIILDFSVTHSHKHSSVPVLSECNTVLLTGATGFLGQFILLELLTNPKCNLIYCLVRSTKGRRTEPLVCAVN